MLVRSQRPGVSLVEVLVVIGLIGVLVGLLLPAVQSARGASSRAVCQSNLRQLGLALQNYESHHGALPPEWMTFSPPPGKSFGASVSWRATLLPYLEQTTMWTDAVAAARLDSYSYHNPPHSPSGSVVRGFICSADARLSEPLTDSQTGVAAAYTSYVGVAGRYPTGEWQNPRNLGVFAFPSGTRFKDILDGASNTIAVGERPPPDSLDNGWWYSATCFQPEMGGICRGPKTSMLVDFPLSASLGGCSGPFFFGPGRLNNPCDSHHFWSLHAGGANFLFADGAVRFLSYGAKDVMAALATRAGGESVHLPD